MTEQMNGATDEMLILPDLTEAIDDVAEGTYCARIVGHKVDKWEGKDGKPSTRYVKWELETFNEEDPKNNGRKLWYVTPISGKGAFKFKKFYKAVFGQDYVPSNDGFNPSMFYTQEVSVTVTNETGKNGKTYPTPSAVSALKQ